MNSLTLLLFRFYPLLLLLQTFSTSPHKIPRLSPFHKEASILRKADDSLSSSDDFETYYYTQILDHFNYAPQSYATFRQRYVVSSKYWGGAASNSPIFAYLGAEDPLDEDLPIIGFLSDNAAYFKSLSVYIEVLNTIYLIVFVFYFIAIYLNMLIETYVTCMMQMNALLHHSFVFY